VLAVRQVTQQQPCVNDIEGLAGKRPRDDVVSHHPQVVLRKPREESRIEVCREHVTFGRDTLVQPLCNGSVPCADFPA
jgi:hypothetical protein